MQQQVSDACNDGWEFLVQQAEDVLLVNKFVEAMLDTEKSKH
jgi:hypothetical protein